MAGCLGKWQRWKRWIYGAGRYSRYLGYAYWLAHRILLALFLWRLMLIEKPRPKIKTNKRSDKVKKNWGEKNTLCGLSPPHWRRFLQSTLLTFCLLNKNTQIGATGKPIYCPWRKGAEKKSGKSVGRENWPPGDFLSYFHRKMYRILCRWHARPIGKFSSGLWNRDILAKLFAFAEKYLKRGPRVALAVAK